MGKTVDDPSISTVEDSLLAQQDIKLKNIIHITINEAIKFFLYI